MLATRNAGKLAEFGRLLAPAGWELAGLDQTAGGASVTWEEDGPDYPSNAAIKARAVAGALGALALGDDSGIEVPSLGGWPGLRSARWLGPAADDADRLRGLLRRLAPLAAEDRRAVFVCALALAAPDRRGGAVLLARVEARAEGLVLAERRGAGGFGYDPVFVPSGERRTTAEMGAAEKDRVSHRGRAVGLLLAALAASVAPVPGGDRRRAPGPEPGDPPAGQVGG
ncbi:MAG TPA: non-canonical purine NTP pyrophosphatase [Candidatus Micrarchaeia archaeon]|nr:non-canonical purine NTP pyrophosphatase [Candidatus Micrarchaeia archaeon]